MFEVLIIVLNNFKFLHLKKFIRLLLDILIILKIDVHILTKS